VTSWLRLRVPRVWCLLALGAVATLGSIEQGRSAAAVGAVTGESYFVARRDLRMCPSPACGGWFVRRVNVATAACPDGSMRRECYVARVDFGPLKLDQRTAADLLAELGRGRAIVRGRLVAAHVKSSLDLGLLRATEGWRSSSSVRPAAGVLRLLTDNGIRCITTPCFSVDALDLNTRRGRAVSAVDLSRVRVPDAERRRALGRLARDGLIADGRIVIDRKAGPAGPGRTVEADQLYVRIER
jgi:hypothetical protein